MSDIELSTKAQQIYERYQKGYVTDEQLLKYLKLKKLTQEEYDYIYTSKHPVEDEEVEDADNTNNDAEVE